ncbi:E3 ubiquitin-protein ligase HUWE1 isoform X5 [Lepidochelys kempii]|uniref:E3 ubiquitin-protein ligase HUWE1 isoform X5 n=1 Tax=Lepidochelys kempii TaxID=8472 RepID=UPI003C6F12AE
MKVDRTKLKKTPTEAPADCRALIDKLKVCNDEQLLLELQQIKTWNIGKCELYHWVDLLDRFDGILADAGQTVENMLWMLVCDRPEREQLKALLLAVLNFTALLIEYSFSRHLYSSIEHLTTLLASSDMQVVLAVLNLLYVFSKRSNYITRLGSDKRAPLLSRLQHLAESWGGKENGFGLAGCCRDLLMVKYPPSATTLHFEFYADLGTEVKVDKRTTSNTLHYIHIEQLDKISESPSEIMESLTKMYSIPKDKQMLLFTHIRLAHGFSNHRKRLQAVQARLHAISILVYSNALQESASSILYNGLIEELVDVLQITDKQLMDIKAASLRTLTSIVHLERTPKLSSIIDCTGTASYHGFLPVLVRNCIQAMIDPTMEPYPHQFATALFSFLYHLASYDAGGEALVSCGMMEALLKVIKFLGDEQDQITFVTRAVRVVDLITNLDMAAFQSHSGLSIFIYRLEHEVDLCRRECPFVIKPKIQRPPTAPLQEGEEMETDMEVSDVAMESSPGPSTSAEPRPEAAVVVVAEARMPSAVAPSCSISSATSAVVAPRSGVQCIPQRAALLKSMLNFLKKAIQDPAFSDGIRHVMDGSLPTSLKHVISNAEYYGPSLFLLATEVVTVFVFQEPSLLSSLQDNGLTDVMLHALLIKDVPATREVLGSLPNVFSALCLNARGLQSFVQCQPFERLFKVLLSPDYLPAMRRRRSSDPLGDTASNLGSAVDELMRHQPTLKTDATTAIIKLLEEICNLGRDPKYICQKPSIQKADGTATAPPPRSTHAAEEASSEDEEEEEVQAMQSFNATQQSEAEPSQQVVGTEERIPIPLMDYILNVMKFVESILSNNTTDDHCQEFVSQKGLLPLVTILGLPNLPIDFPTSAACQAVAGVCKSILTLSHEPKVLQEGLLQLDSILSSLEPLHRPIEAPGGSVLLRELASAGNVADATLSAQATPLLHALTAAHAYIMMFVHTCRVGQSEIRAISVNQWGSHLGLSVLSKLSQLYCSLVWESTVLLSLCTPNSLPTGCEFGQADMQKLVPKEEKAAPNAPQGAKKAEGEVEAVAGGSVEPSAQGLLEGIGLDGDALAPMETDEPSTADAKGKAKITPAMAARIKQIKPLLSASSRLGRALAELFGLLVKLCVGSPVRQRRSHHAASTTTAPTPAARSTASALTKLLTKGLSWQPPPYTPTPRFRLTFFICSVGFTSPMLFDERKYPYHLMLQKFLCSGGHNALFETFNWALSMGGKVPVAEGLEHPDLPDGTGEFLDAWLMLVEKMVNPSTVLESPHALPAKLPGGQNYPQFSALRFLVVTQKAAFTCIKNLWNRKPLKVYGGRMAESMLAILCHILRGEPLIRERLGKEKEGARGEEEAGQEEGGARREPQVNQQQLQQLMDMGFTREHAMEALLNTSTMEQATEYLLTHPPPLVGGVVRDLSMSEEDQMMRAIAMSLGQDIPMEQRAESPEEAACRKEEEERKAREKQEEEEAKCLEKFEDAQPLDPAELHGFTDAMLPGCSQLLDELPDTVYRVCDLIMTAVKRNGAPYRDTILKQVVKQVWEAADVLIKAALPLTTSDTKTVSEWISQMATLPQAANLATRILLLTLLFEELKLPCARVVESSGVLNVLIKLLEVVQPCLQAAKEQKEVQTPKWITPVLLLIDFYEKTAISSKRRAQMNKVVRSAATSGAGSTTSGVVSGSLGSREINYILRVLGPAACRNPEIFTEVANGCIRIALPAPRGSGTASDDEFENLRIKGPNAVQLVKTTPVKPSALPVIPDPIKEVIYDMLNALAAYHAPDEAEKSETKLGTASQEVSQLLSDVGDDVYQQYRSLTRQGSDFDSQSGFAITAQVFSADGTAAETPPSGTPQGEASTPEESREGRKDKEGDKATEEGKQKAKGSKPLMPTSTILRLLAELVRSYVGIATLIANYSYTVGQSELIKEQDCSVLAFVLDHLLPHTQNVEDKDTPALARLFLASLAAAGSGTDAQVALVNEVKAALGRALAMAESTEKHARLQAVMCIISTIMESCPSTSSFYSSAAAKTQHNGMNNIIRLFLKKGLVSDLARVPHSLDLSSPNMANTVNAALKPLETLSRIVNQPSSLFGSKSTASKSKAEGEAQGAARDANSNQQDVGEPGEAGAHEEDQDAGQAEVADGDIMDGEAEGDAVVIAGQPEVLSTQEMQVENELEDLIDELLERDGGPGNSTIIVSRSGEEDAPEDVLMDEAPSNLSQGSTLQANREDSMNILDPEDEEEHTQEEDSSGSNEDEDDSQDEEEEEEEEDEDDQDDEEGEEGEEEEEDDDGSEMELDEDYPDMNASPLVRFERFDREDDLIIEFDNMFSSATDIPPSPGNIPATHPLMVRHADHGSLTLGSGSSTTRLAQGIGRSQRTLRQLTANTGHTIHVHYPGTRQPNPPLILQRLLGPSAAADILQLSSSLPLQSRGRARLLVGNDDVHIIARSDDELLDDFFHDQSTATSQAGTLSSIPTALTRWTEECKVLDAESMHDCVSVVKVPIVNHLEALRDEELEERREKRRKQLAEEEAKATDKAKEEKDGKEQSAQGVVPTPNTATEQSLSDVASRTDGFPATPPTAEGPSTGPKQTLVTLETPQPATAGGELPPELTGQPSTDASRQLLVPAEQEDSGPGRPSADAEATQMELSPAPTITSLSPERAEDSDALTAVSSQLEGSPMDTSSLASCSLEEGVGEGAVPSGAEQPPAHGARGAEPAQQRPEGQAGSDSLVDASQQGEDSSPPASSSESSSTRDSAVAISGADSRGILEEPLPSTSSEEEDPLAGINLPEGVDPSFLAALPDDIRREVLQNQLGIRPPARPPPTATTPTPPVVSNPGVTEVSPEFLAALPPAIQEEVLAQQRVEQQRRELAQGISSDTPMDPVTFIQTLPSDLRRSVLEDMEDSVLAVMPPDIAAEAQALRREQEARQRQLMHERLFGHSSTSALSAILRSPAFTSRLSGNRGVQYTRLAVQRGGTFHMGGSSSHSRPSGSMVDSLLRLRGRLLLDHEALSCLLVLLFVDEPKLNTSRLHRVLRNLCYHGQTRGWVIRSLLSILQRSSESEPCLETPKGPPDERGKRAAKAGTPEGRPLELLHKMEARSSGQLSWLSVSMDAALGCRTNIFQIQRAGGRKHTEKHAAGTAAGAAVHIHPQAAPVVCRHVLDTLIQLAKVFPSHFTQQRPKEAPCEGERGARQSGSPGQASGISTDFWDLLVKLDNMNVSRKGKNSVKSVPVSAGAEGESSPYSLEASPLGQLMNMLSHPVIRRSSLLTEKLLRLLSLISIALPENKAPEGPGAAPAPTAPSAGAAAPAPAPTVPAPAKGSKSPAKAGEAGGGGTDPKVVASGLTENQLQLSVEVLTSHSCSEEGLEDAANVLLQLSRGDSPTRDTVLRLLLSGARQLGYTLCKQIGTLLAELREYNLEQQRRAQCELLSPDGLPDEQPQTTKLKGKMQSRFDMAENVVIVASQKRPLGGRELQLPSMSMLTSKTSTQKFFLRVLQVIIQLRDDTRRANKKAKQTGRLGSSGLGSANSIQAAVRQLEAEADAIIQMVREGQRARRQQQAATSESSQSEGAVRRDESPMDVDQPSPVTQDAQLVGSEGSQPGEKDERPPDLPLLSEQLNLDELWAMLGECLKELEESHDQHAVLVLQPAVEAFFLVHATERESKPPVRDTRESQLAHIKDEPPPLSPAPLTPATPSSLDPFFSREPSSMHISSSLPPDTQKFLRFAETHRTVLNQILRQSTTHLADGPFAVLVDYIRVLDFDVKRKYFRQELERLDEGLRKEDMAVHVRRDHVFEDSYRELHRKSPEEMKNRLYIVFEGEEGQDAGGLLREWYMIISREMFNPMYALFRTSPGDRVTYTINPSSHCNPNHLSYFKFVGRIVAKAVYDNRLLECYFTRSFYKHILGKSVRYTDMESEDYHFYQGLVYLLENDVSTLGYDLTFSTEVQEFGVCEVRDLKPNGANILVTEENKKEYVHLVCQMRMTGAIRKQLAAFLEGFYEIIPKRLISIFTEQELELLISGLPTIDIDDLKSNTEYHKYQSNSIQIQWFWRALRSFDQADRAKFLQFVTGTSKVPLQGFAALEGMNGIQKFQIHRDDRSTDRLPSAHTCFNQLDLPAYESYEKLRHMLLLAIQECSEGFGLA